MSTDKLLTKSFLQSWKKAMHALALSGKDLPLETGAKKHWFQAEKGISDILKEVDAANEACLAALENPKKLKSAYEKFEKKSKSVYKMGDAYLDKVFKANKGGSKELDQARIKLKALESEAEIRVTYYKDKVKELAGKPDKQIEKGDIKAVITAYLAFQKEWMALDSAIRPALLKASKTLDIKFKDNDNPAPKEIAPYVAVISEALGKKRLARFRAVIGKYARILPAVNHGIGTKDTRVDKLMDGLDLTIRIMENDLKGAKSLRELRKAMDLYEDKLNMSRADINMAVINAKKK
ncbi:hypothetical protein M2103_002074 [Ereboglobus sp. PH5-5]|uniref:hypothetical protein n=1 Tax=unclassified Ereboglobus TaxID=2626932 RepID=UPI002404EC06|nr:MULTISPECIES: hypothetical protein [unclassified Ereboglobus]MDF9826253.1 hypothetical protein [Ereboglobus sp. PH5-10]MDF9833841.1 hypothetical protein [Ereboglobus sp. PH5-5]